MREILFRGKRIDNGELIVGQLLRYEDGRARICESHTDIFCYENDQSIIQTVAHEVCPDTVGQFIGLTDKNGTKIFEGDILDVMHQGAFECRWDSGNFEFGLSNNKESFGIAYVSPNDIFVIGNIHDNPELLEVTDNA